MAQDRQRPPSASAEIALLATELGELARTAPGRLAERLATLSIREQAELALRLPAKERLELLLHAPRPMRLVRALPDFELYITARELGPADALPLVALASAEQIVHVVDLESWRGDRFDAPRAGGWVALLLEAGEPALRRFLRAADDDLLTLLYQRWVRTTPVESADDVELHGAHLPEAGDERGLRSPDGSYHFNPVIPEHAPAVQRIAQILFLDQPDRYRRILWSSVWQLPAELEEETLAWRQSRLEEHGFPPWEEALSVYAAPAGVRAHPQTLPAADPDGLAVPRAPIRMLPPRSRLALALDRLPPVARERLLHELVALANRLLVADGADTGDPAAHRAALATAAGYAGIALEARGLDDPTEVDRLLAEVPLIELFREGYARAVELAQRARRLPAATVELLDSPVREHVAALLARRPLYPEMEQGRRGADRPFRTLGEIHETRVSLEMAEVVASVLVDRLGVDLGGLLRHAQRQQRDPPRLSALFLTALAWHAVRAEVRSDPLPPDEAADFLRGVASRRTAAPDAPARALEALVRALERQLGLGPRDVALLEAFGRACLEQLAASCALLDPGVPVDPRSVPCLLLA